MAYSVHRDRPGGLRQRGLCLWANDGNCPGGGAAEVQVNILAWLGWVKHLTSCSSPYSSCSSPSSSPSPSSSLARLLRLDAGGDSPSTDTSKSSSSSSISSCVRLAGVTDPNMIAALWLIVRRGGVEMRPRQSSKRDTGRREARFANHGSLRQRPDPCPDQLTPTSALLPRCHLAFWEV